MILPFPGRKGIPTGLHKVKPQVVYWLRMMDKVLVLGEVGIAKSETAETIERGCWRKITSPPLLDIFKSPMPAGEGKLG